MDVQTITVFYYISKIFYDMMHFYQYLPCDGHLSRVFFDGRSCALQQIFPSKGTVVSFFPARLVMDSRFVSLCLLSNFSVRINRG